MANSSNGAVSSTSGKDRFIASTQKLKICIAGGAGFIGSHVARRLKQEGHYVVVADWERNLYFKEEEFCDEFLLLDLRSLDNCLRATQGCDWVFNFAADMGGMGFIHGNNAVILYNNTMLDFNMVEAARRNKVKRFFYASTACVYPNFKQTTEQVRSFLRFFFFVGFRGQGVQQ
jgi:GDP-D-mannose 3',5'-epimerase